MEVEIGIGKSGRRAYGFDDIAIVPSRRTRDPEDVDISWEVDAYKFDLPMMAAAMDGVVSPASAIEMGKLGGLGCLNLEGLWTRYEDPDAVLAEIEHAGEVLLGQDTTFSAGNYLIGIPAALPTSGYARATSGVTAGR